MPQRLRHDAYRVGWICPLEVEQIAAMQMLDEEHEGLPLRPGDENVYILGSINKQNIVIAGLPGQGNCFAASVIAQMRMAFSSLKYVLLVGIGGGVPVKTRHGMIRLGHVVVSDPTGIHSGVVQYDHGKSKTGQFERTGCLSPPPQALLSAARVLQVKREGMDYDPIWTNLKRFQTKRRINSRFKFPGAENDHLYHPDCEHQVKDVSCEESACPQEQRIKRIPDEEEESWVVVHRGTIASGELVMKNAKQRDELAREHSVLCFEMEAAGALTGFPCLVIRGISDYCDSHKNDVWHAYASAVAAAYARALICYLPVEEIERSEIKTETKADHQFRYFVVPSLDKRHFTGRETTLEQLQQRLFIQANTQKLALFGLSGIGKTQVALQFAHWVKKARPEFSIFWVPAYSLQSFEQACLQIVKEVGIQQRSEDASESARELVHHYLRSNAAGKWLFIVDNADDHDLLITELYQFIPASENGVTLLTTCYREVAVTFATKDIVELDKMALTEGKAFIAKIVREELLCEESTTQLLEELHYLPLAITQAAFYVSRTGITISQYLKLMHKTEKNRADLASRKFFDCTRYPSKDNAITTTFIISFERIKNSEPDAAELLEFLSYIEPKAIPRSMLPLLKSEENTEFAIGTLWDYAFLTRRDDGKELDMHGLVQLSTRQWVEKAGHTQQVIQKAIQHMDDCFPSDEFTCREVWRTYLPHTLKLIHRCESKGTNERYSLLAKAGGCAMAESRAKEAIGLFEEVSMWQKSQHDEEQHTDRLLSQHALAEAYELDGQRKLALQIFERGVAILEETADEKDRFLLAYQYSLALTYRSNGKIKDAVKLLEHVVRVQERKCDEKHHDRLGSQQALAEAYQSDGQIKRAIKIFEHVAKIREDTLHEEDPNLVSSQYALAKAYKSDGKIKEAIKLLDHVVMIRKRTLHEDNPERLSCQHVLAKAYQSSDQIEQAIQFLEHVVQVRKRTLNEEDRKLLSSQHDLGKAYQSAGQADLAIQSLEHVVRVRKRTLNEEDPKLLSSQHDLGKAHQSAGQSEIAVQILEHVVEVRDRTLEEEDSKRLSSQHLLAVAYRSNGQSKLAVRKLEHVVEVRENTLGEEDNNRLGSQHALGKAYHRNGQFKEAVQILKHVVAIKQRTLDEKHPSLLSSKKALAMAKKSSRRKTTYID
ncbi:uncharacterized protein N7484_011651 [Penicillium longicatenatum]|uniref:uncharacterized protein n=1 Tax=Penicillium longicatenatum TaxID=1561947 RepID=UPI00254860C8|nr:uncharacterized protein N7484_011651 [Penicillium longicatenatum]KAJ5631551.1 hypothetical protein N7484_011651 [Penicillium longicatenatum]